MTFLLGDTGTYSATEITVPAGYIDGYEFTATHTGAVRDLHFTTSATAPTCTSLVLGVYDAVTGDVCDWNYTTAIAASSTLVTTSLYAEIVAGNTYLLTVQPIGGTVSYNVANTGGTGRRTSGSSGDGTSPFPASSAQNVGPVGFYGLGDAVIQARGLAFQLTGLWMPGETTVPFYGQISDPQNGEVVIPLNDSRTASVTVSVFDPVVETLATLAQVPYAVHLKVFYEGLLVFWGPIKVRAADLVAGTIRLDAVDMTLRMIKHFIREGDLLLGGGQVDATTGDGWLPISGDGLKRLRDATKTVSFPALGIQDGTDSFTADPNAIIDVHRGDQIYNTWQRVQQTLGPDWELDPTDSTVQMYATLNVFNRQGSDISAAVQFHCGTGRSNLEGLSFTEGEEYTNLVHVLDRDLKYRRTRTNATALTRTGPYIAWDATDFSTDHVSKTDAEAVLDAAGTDIINAYSVPLVALSLTLPIDTVDGFHYFTDYKLGDTVGVAGKAGFLELPEAPYRITKVTLSQDGDGVRPALEVIADRTGSDMIDGSDT
jgi:hypothetical protein